MSKRSRLAVVLGTVAIAAIAVVVPRLRCQGEMVPSQITDEDRATVQAVLAQDQPPDRITSELVELLVSEQWGVRAAAAQELMRRDLQQRDLNRLETITLMVPFYAEGGDVIVLRWAGMNVGSQQAWEVLEHARTDGRPLDEQIEWYVTQLRYDLPFRGGRGNAVANRLHEIGEPAVPRLIRVMERDSSYAQLWAGRALMGIGTDEAKSALEAWGLRVFEATDDPLVWYIAASWLGDLGSAEAFEPTKRMLWQHLESPYAWQLIRSLAQIDPQRAREPLGRVLTDHQPDADHPELIQPYLSAAFHLAKLGDEHGWAVLEGGVDSPITEMRRRLASVLVATGDARARESLVRLSQDENEAVASVARHQLEELDRTLEQQKQQP